MRGYVEEFSFWKNYHTFILPLTRLLYRQHKGRFFQEKHCFVAHLTTGGNIRLNYPRQTSGNAVLLMDKKGKEYLKRIDVQRIIKIKGKEET